MTFTNNIRTLLQIIVVLLLLNALLLYNEIHQNNIISWNFKGEVKNVWYDEKDYPTVEVNGKKYDLRHLVWHFSIKIDKGDFVMKNKSDLRLKVIRRHTDDTLCFNDWRR